MPTSRASNKVEDGRIIDEAWHWISTLPLEQSLVLGGGGSLAFFELARHARTFLHTHMKSVLDLLFPDSSTAKQKIEVKTVVNANNAPLIARNGPVEAMFLTKTGIFYLKTECLTLYQAQGYCERADPPYAEYVNTALSKLSPHALSLYNEASEKENKRKFIDENLDNKFKELLDDCLLHMLLNDLSCTYFNMEPSSLTAIKPTALNLIRKITLTKRGESKGWPQRAWDFIGFGQNPPPTAASPKTSTQCLNEWATENAQEIQQDVKTIFQEYSARATTTKPNLFFRNSNDWRRNTLEVEGNTSNMQWHNGLAATGCAWNRAIGALQIELELTPTDPNDKDWRSIARLRYTIT